MPQILYAEWKAFATSAEYRAALLTGLRVKELDNHGLAMRKFDSVAAATV